MPLRHEGDEFAACIETGKLGERQLFLAENAGQLFETLVRPCQKILEQTEFLHILQRRRVYRIAAEIAQEIGMFLQNERPAAGARK
jgi:hypothetical protein